MSKKYNYVCPSCGMKLLTKCNFCKYCNTIIHKKDLKKVKVNEAPMEIINEDKLDDFIDNIEDNQVLENKQLISNKLLNSRFNFGLNRGGKYFYTLQDEFKDCTMFYAVVTKTKTGFTGFCPNFEDSKMEDCDTYKRCIDNIKNYLNDKIKEIDLDELKKFRTSTLKKSYPKSKITKLYIKNVE